jgi:hypothetical protein
VPDRRTLAKTIRIFPGVDLLIQCTAGIASCDGAGEADSNLFGRENSIRGGFLPADLRQGDRLE